MAFSPFSSAWRSTNRVCGMGPSTASTSRSTPSTMFMMRSTSPPKSAWPGVSTMLMVMPLYSTLVFFARIVMPRSRSRSLESMMRSTICWFSRKTLVWRNMPSTSVVLPWSTWAMIAMLRISGRGLRRVRSSVRGRVDASSVKSMFFQLQENHKDTKTRRDTKEKAKSMSGAHCKSRSFIAPADSRYDFDQKCNKHRICKGSVTP